MLTSPMIICMCKFRHPQVIKGLQDYQVPCFYVESKYLIFLIKNIYFYLFLAALSLSCDTRDLCCHMQAL